MKQQKTRRLLNQRKLLKQQVNTLTKKLKEIKKERKEISKNIARLDAWTEALNFLSGFEQLEFLYKQNPKEFLDRIPEDKNMNLGRFDGVYIVSERDYPDVVLTKFKDLVKGGETPAKLAIENLLAGRLMGDDGKEVDFSLGALLFVKKVEASGGVGFHMANVGPSDEASALQYEYARSKLGLTPPPKFDKALLSLDGQFRELLTNLSQGKKSS